MNPGPARRPRRCGDCGAGDRTVLVRTEAGWFCRACMNPCTCITRRAAPPHEHSPVGCLVAGCGCTAPSWAA